MNFLLFSSRFAPLFFAPTCTRKSRDHTHDIETMPEQTDLPDGYRALIRAIARAAIDHTLDTDNARSEEPASGDLIAAETQDMAMKEHE